MRNSAGIKISGRLYFAQRRREGLRLENLPPAQEGRFVAIRSVRHRLLVVKTTIETVCVRSLPSLFPRLYYSSLVRSRKKENSFPLSLSSRKTADHLSILSNGGGWSIYVDRTSHNRDTNEFITRTMRNARARVSTLARARTSTFATDPRACVAAYIKERSSVRPIFHACIAILDAYDASGTRLKRAFPSSPDANQTPIHRIIRRLLLLSARGALPSFFPRSRRVWRE